MVFLAQNRKIAGAKQWPIKFSISELKVHTMQQPAKFDNVRQKNPIW